MARKKGSVLTEKQDAYVEGVLQGKTKQQALKDAGYSEKGRGAVVEKSADVVAALAQARSELATSTKTTREDVLGMFKRAYDLAELAAEPSSMVSAAKEIGKMLGFYEPETIKVQLSMGQARLQEKFVMMSDEDLLEIAQGKAKIIDGEFTRVE